MNVVLVLVVGIPTWRGFLELHQQTNKCFLALFTLASIVVMYYFLYCCWFYSWRRCCFCSFVFCPIFHHNDNDYDCIRILDSERGSVPLLCIAVGAVVT